MQLWDKVKSLMPSFLKASGSVHDKVVSQELADMEASKPENAFTATSKAHPFINSEGQHNFGFTGQ